MSVRNSWPIAACLCLCLAGCGDDEQPSAELDATDSTDATDDASSSADTVPAEDVANDSSAPDTSTEDAAANTDAEDATEPDAADDAATDVPTDTGATNLLVGCHDLEFEIACDRPEAASGYYACSDYFGNTTGVEVQCSASPNTDVRVGGPPCGARDHYVGSCVYYTDAEPLDDRCYVTHVHAETADGVDAGQAFWSANCAGEWIEGD